MFCDIMIKMDQRNAIMKDGNHNKERLKELSVYLAYILRHNPAAAGIELDRNGWADVGELIGGMCRAGREIDRGTLEEIVKTDEKGRYSFNGDGSKIRANQGHSIDVDVGLEEKIPPEILFHGTAERFLEGIRRTGLSKMSRRYVHLSKDEETAKKVGARHGKPIVLQIEAGRMRRDGYKFFLSANGVWLTESVPIGYIHL